VRTDNAFRQALDGEVLEANFAIRLPGRMDDDEISWVTGRTKCLFNAVIERLGDAHQRESVHGDGRSVLDRRDSLLD
jgi:hypothetical protein